MGISKLTTRQSAFFLANSDYSQEQSIVSPAGYDFVYPPNKYSGKIPSVNTLVTSLNSSISIPFYSFSNYKLEAIGEYSYAFDNVVEGLDWKINSLSFGLQVSYNFASQLESKIDTIISRDTIISFVPNLRQEQITLLSTDKEESSERSQELIITTISISEKYERQIPKPTAILTGNLELKFVNTANTESSNTSIPVKKLIQKDNFFAINIGSKSSQIKFTKLFTISDTSDFTHLPTIKLMADATSEAGLKSWEIQFFSKDMLINSFAGNEDNISEEKLWDLNFNKSPDVISELSYKLILEDYDNQKVEASSGIIKFDYDKSSKIFEIKEANYYTIPLSELSVIDNKDLENNFYVKISKCAIIKGKNSNLTSEQITLVKLLADKYQISYEENPNPKTMGKLIENSNNDMLIFYSK